MKVQFMTVVVWTSVRLNFPLTSSPPLLSTTPSATTPTIKNN